MSKSYLRQVRKEIREMVAYQSSPIDFAIKLDAMENPYSFPQELRAGWNAALAACEVNRYPDAAATALKQQLATHVSVPADCKLLLGNGSDELIQLVALALTQEGACLLSPEPSFVIYPMVATIASMDYLSVPLHNKDFSLDLVQMLKLLEQRQPALVCLAQPNNPTANLWNSNDVEEIIRRAPGYVLIDEAYAPFTSYSQLHLLEKYPNLLILRTFSKVGFAGLRLGFLIGHGEIIDSLDKLRLPYNIGSLVQCSIKFALDNFAPIQKQIDQICQSRSLLFDGLQSISGITPFPSQTNFILFRVPRGKANSIFTSLKERSILIKDVSTIAGLEDCLRVSVGTSEENQTFIAALSCAQTGEGEA